MKSLMDVCRNFGEEDCHPDISKWKYWGGQIENGDPIPTKPLKKDADKICKNCRALYIRECPNCESTNFFVNSDFEIKKKGKKIEKLSFYCDNCKRIFEITRPV